MLLSLSKCCVRMSCAHALLNERFMVGRASVAFSFFRNVLLCAPFSRIISTEIYQETKVSQPVLSFISCIQFPAHACVIVKGVANILAVQ